MLNMHILDWALVCVYLTATHSCLCFGSIGMNFFPKFQSIQSTDIILSGSAQAMGGAGRGAHQHLSTLPVQVGKCIFKLNTC